MPRLPALKYLMNELKFKTSEWTSLANEDRERLKQMAEEEQDYIEAQSK